MHHPQLGLRGHAPSVPPGRRIAGRRSTLRPWRHPRTGSSGSGGCAGGCAAPGPRPRSCCFTVVDALLLARLPFAGDRGSGAAGALLAVRVPEPPHGRGRRPADRAVAAAPRPAAARARRARPRSVWALGGLCALLVAGGLAHRPALRDEERALRAQAIAARDYFARQAPPRVPAQPRAHGHLEAGTGPLPDLPSGAGPRPQPLRDRDAPTSRRRASRSTAARSPTGGSPGRRRTSIPGPLTAL